MAGDDEMFSAVTEAAIGARTRCPRCMRMGTIDDVHEGRVIIRHGAELWHVISAEEASAIRWEPHIQKRY